MGHNTNVWVTGQLIGHYGRMSYEESFVRLSKIKIVQVKYIII